MEFPKRGFIIHHEFKDVFQLREELVYFTVYSNFGRIMISIPHKNFCFLIAEEYPYEHIRDSLIAALNPIFSINDEDIAYVFLNFIYNELLDHPYLKEVK